MPGLLTLKTDLKSLKYGHDTPGGGDSGQPYIKTDINSIDATINKVRLTKFDDGLIRGGIIGATNAAITDTLRIGKFLTDFPKGPLFIVKQVGLQLTNPRVESTTLPTNKATKGQGAVTNVINFVSNVANKIENAVGPTRIYNLGINTLAQVPVNAIGGHIVRHGFLPNNDSSKYYENVVTIKNFQNNTNRLLDLTNNFNLGPWGANKLGVNKKEQGFLNKLAGAVSTNPMGSAIFGAATAIFNTNKELEVDSYLGGANSVYGIGVTTIHRAMGGDTENKDKIDFAREQSAMFAGKTRNDKGNPAIITGLQRLTGVSNNTQSIFGVDDFPEIIPGKTKGIISTDTFPFYYGKSTDTTVRTATGANYLDLASKGQGPSSYPGTATGSGTYANDLKLPNNVYGAKPTYQTVATTVNKLTAPNNLGIYKTLITSQSNGERLPISPYYPTYSNGLTTPGPNGILIPETVKIKIPWNKVTREKRVGSGRRDSINLTPLFGGTMSGGVGNKYWMKDKVVTVNGVGHNIRDLVKFRISSVLTDSPELVNTMVFRAYLTNLTDSVDATWNGVKYAGRGNPFYIYDGFTRKVQIGFKVAALSEGEMQPMYSKLNYLMSTLMPDYNGILMRGSLVRMTVGNYFDAQLGKLDSLSYTIPNDSPWEIALDEPEGGSKQLILPHILEVSLGFTPIGTETQGENRIEDKVRTNTYIAQNNTGKDKDTIQYYDYFKNKF
jgi:hypothetical protein